MARLTEEKLEKYLLLVSTVVTSVVVGLFLGLTWAMIDLTEYPAAFAERQLLNKAAYFVAFACYLLTYALFVKRRFRFYLIGITGFAFTFIASALFAQTCLSLRISFNHDFFGSSLIWTILFGFASSFMSMSIGKLIAISTVFLLRKTEPLP